MLKPNVNILVRDLVFKGNLWKIILVKYRTDSYNHTFAINKPQEFEITFLRSNKNRRSGKFPQHIIYIIFLTYQMQLTVFDARNVIIDHSLWYGSITNENNLPIILKSRDWLNNYITFLLCLVFYYINGTLVNHKYGSLAPSYSKLSMSNWIDAYVKFNQKNY